MKKTVVLIAFLFAMSVALVAAQTNNVTSYDPSKRIDNPTSQVLGEMTRRADLGLATAAERATLREAQNPVRLPDRDTRDPFMEQHWDGMTALPGDWTLEGPSTSNWSIAQSNNAGGDVPELRFYWSPYTEGTYRCISPVFSTAGETALLMSFNYNLNHYGGDYTIGMATSSDGANWNPVWELVNPGVSIAATPVEAICANGDVGSETFQFCFYFIGIPYNLNYWYIDDIIVDLPPTGPQLSAGTVSPESGNTTNPFEYSVTYMHTDGTAPTVYQVVIDGTGYDMVAPASPNYITGATYTYSTTLGLGTHDYYFHFGDGTDEAYLPDTAPTTPYVGPNVYTALTGTLSINGAGGGDYTTFQECFDALTTQGIDGPVNVEVAAGTYVEEATIDGTIAGSNASDIVHFYPVGGSVIVDGSAQAVWSSIYVYNSGNVWFDGFEFIGGWQGGFRAELSSNVWVSHCNSHDTNWVGFGFSECTDVKAWNNMSSNNGTQGIGFYDCGVSANVYAWNNSIYQLNSSSGSFAMGATISNSDVVFYNNILYRDCAAVSDYGVIFVDQDWTTHPNTLIDYNNYYNTDGAPIVMCYNSGTSNYDQLYNAR